MAAPGCDLAGEAIDMTETEEEEGDGDSDKDRTGSGVREGK